MFCITRIFLFLSLVFLVFCNNTFYDFGQNSYTDDWVGGSDSFTYDTHIHPLFSSSEDEHGWLLSVHPDSSSTGQWDLTDNVHSIFNSALIFNRKFFILRPQTPISISLQ